MKPWSRARLLPLLCLAAALASPFPALPAMPVSHAAPAVAAPSTAQKPDIREIRLENGLRIFVLERSASPTFAGYYQFGVGGASDPKGRSGIAHLLEHMMFKGTASVGTLNAAAEAPLQKRLSELWHRLDRETDRSEDPFQHADPSSESANGARVLRWRSVSTCPGPWWWRRWGSRARSCR